MRKVMAGSSDAFFPWLSDEDYNQEQPQDGLLPESTGNTFSSDEFFSLPTQEPLESNLNSQGSSYYPTQTFGQSAPPPQDSAPAATTMSNEGRATKRRRLNHSAAAQSAVDDTAEEDVASGSGRFDFDRAADSFLSPRRPRLSNTSADMTQQIQQFHDFEPPLAGPMWRLPPGDVVDFGILRRPSPPRSRENPAAAQAQRAPRPLALEHGGGPTGASSSGIMGPSSLVGGIEDLQAIDLTAVTDAASFRRRENLDEEERQARRDASLKLEHRKQANQRMLASALAEQKQNDPKKSDMTVQGIGAMQCVICMDDFTDLTATPCGHLFCHTCINEHLITAEMNRTTHRGALCPFCRQNIVRKPQSAKEKERTIVPLSFKVKPKSATTAKTNPPSATATNVRKNSGTTGEPQRRAVELPD